MNKRDAKRYALQTAISLLDKEIHSPSALTAPLIGGDFPINYDRDKVSVQLEIIRDQLLVKLQSFAEEMP